MSSNLPRVHSMDLARSDPLVSYKDVDTSSLGDFRSSNWTGHRRRQYHDTPHETRGLRRAQSFTASGSTQRRGTSLSRSATVGSFALPRSSCIQRKDVLCSSTPRDKPSTEVSSSRKSPSSSNIPRWTKRAENDHPSPTSSSSTTEGSQNADHRAAEECQDSLPEVQRQREERLFQKTREENSQQTCDRMKNSSSMKSPHDSQTQKYDRQTLYDVCVENGKANALEDQTQHKTYTSRKDNSPSVLPTASFMSSVMSSSSEKRLSNKQCLYQIAEDVSNENQAVADPESNTTVNPVSDKTGGELLSSKECRLETASKKDGTDGQNECKDMQSSVGETDSQLQRLDFHEQRRSCTSDTEENNTKSPHQLVYDKYFRRRENSLQVGQHQEQKVISRDRSSQRIEGSTRTGENRMPDTVTREARTRLTHDKDERRNQHGHTSGTTITGGLTETETKTFPSLFISATREKIKSVYISSKQIRPSQETLDTKNALSSRLQPPHKEPYTAIREDDTSAENNVLRTVSSGKPAAQEPISKDTDKEMEHITAVEGKNETRKMSTEKVTYKSYHEMKINSTTSVSENTAPVSERPSISSAVYKQSGSSPSRLQDVSSSTSAQKSAIQTTVMVPSAVETTSKVLTTVSRTTSSASSITTTTQSSSKYPRMDVGAPSTSSKTAGSSSITQQFPNHREPSQLQEITSNSDTRSIVRPHNGSVEAKLPNSLCSVRPRYMLATKSSAAKGTPTTNAAGVFDKVSSSPSGSPAHSNKQMMIESDAVSSAIKGTSITNGESVFESVNSSPSGSPAGSNTRTVIKSETATASMKTTPIKQTTIQEKGAVNITNLNVSVNNKQVTDEGQTVQAHDAQFINNTARVLRSQQAKEDRVFEKQRRQPNKELRQTNASGVSSLTGLNTVIYGSDGSSGAVSSRSSSTVSPENPWKGTARTVKNFTPPLDFSRDKSNSSNEGSKEMQFSLSSLDNKKFQKNKDASTVPLTTRPSPASGLTNDKISGFFSAREYSVSQTRERLFHSRRTEREKGSSRNQPVLQDLHENFQKSKISVITSQQQKTEQPISVTLCSSTLPKSTVVSPLDIVSLSPLSSPEGGSPASPAFSESGPFSTLDFCSDVPHSPVSPSEGLDEILIKNIEYLSTDEESMSSRQIKRKKRNYKAGEEPRRSRSLRKKTLTNRSSTSSPVRKSKEKGKVVREKAKTSGVQIPVTAAPISAAEENEVTHVPASADTKRSRTDTRVTTGGSVTPHKAARHSSQNRGQMSGWTGHWNTENKDKRTGSVDRQSALYRPRVRHASVPPQIDAAHDVKDRGTAELNKAGSDRASGTGDGERCNGGNEEDPKRNTSGPAAGETVANKVNSIRSRFARAGTSENVNPTDDAKPTTILRPNRSKDFSQLLHKFSSNLEVSSNGAQRSTVNSSQRNRVQQSDKQPGDEETGNDIKSNAARRIPERAQSVRVGPSTDKEPKKVEKGPERSSSFKSSFMQRRFSPVRQTDAPSAELSAVLNRRQKEVERQQQEDDLDMDRRGDKRQAKAEPVQASSAIEEIIADQEVAKVLKARRKVTDFAADTQCDISSAGRSLTARDSQPPQPAKGDRESVPGREKAKTTENENASSSKSSQSTKSDTANHSNSDLGTRVSSARAQLESKTTHTRDTVTTSAKLSSLPVASSRTVSFLSAREKSALPRTDSGGPASSHLTQNRTKARREGSDTTSNEAPGGREPWNIKSRQQKTVTENERSSATSHSNIGKDQTAISRKSEVGENKGKTRTTTSSLVVNLSSTEKKSSSTFSTVRRAESLKADSSSPLTETFGTKARKGADTTPHESSGDREPLNIKSRQEKKLSESESTPITGHDDSGKEQTAISGKSELGENKGRTSATTSSSVVSLSSSDNKKSSSTFSTALRRAESLKSSPLTENVRTNARKEGSDSRPTQDTSSGGRETLDIKSRQQKTVAGSESSSATNHSSIGKDQTAISGESKFGENKGKTSTTTSSLVVNLSSTDKKSFSTFSTSLRRTESLKVDSPVKGNVSSEYRKVLERTPSLPKQQSGSVVDRQYLRIIEQRRRKEEERVKETKERRPMTEEKTSGHDGSASAAQKTENNEREKLAEKVKVFSQKSETDSTPDKSARSMYSSLPRYRQRKQQSSRFATQPVTSEEVKRALHMPSGDNQKGKDAGDELAQKQGVSQLRDMQKKRSNIILSQLEPESFPDTSTSNTRVGVHVLRQQDNGLQDQHAEHSTKDETEEKDRPVANVLSKSSVRSCFSQETSATPTENISTTQQATLDLNEDRASPVADLILPTDDTGLEVSETSVILLNDVNTGESTTDPVPQEEDLCGTRSDTTSERLPTDRHQTKTTQQLNTEKSSTSRSAVSYSTPDETTKADSAMTPMITTPGSSIADRMNQLKTRGEERWKKRVSKMKDMDTPVLGVKGDEKKPVTISDRLTELEESAKQWTVRVEETDAKQFTVADKLSRTDSAAGSKSSFVAKVLASSKKDLTEQDDSPNVSSAETSPVTRRKELLPSVPLPKEIIADPEAEQIFKKSKTEQKVELKGVEQQETPAPVRVEVPQMDDAEIQQFFSTREIEISDTSSFCVSDFDTIKSNETLQSVKKIRPARKQKASSHNPLKTVSRFVEIQTEYTQVRTGQYAELLIKIETDSPGQKSSFAPSAIAALASRENFKAVELRKTESGSLPASLASRQNPYSDLMLLHIKGRRNTQTRLVEPCSKSVNAGDCYVLVTKDKVVNWIGEFSNVIEKAKAAEVASFIQQHRDLGFKGTAAVQTVDQKRDHMPAGRYFWEMLQGEKECQVCGPDEEDELYEISVTKTNMVYRLTDGALHPYEKYWGAIPKYEMLEKGEILVFDFGSEFYVWQGTAVSPEERKLSMVLAKKLWDKGYDYSQCAVNPLGPLRTEENGGVPVKASERPKWVIFGKINQHMETVLFREKFADWPDISALASQKSRDPAKIKYEFGDVTAVDVKKMTEVNDSPVTLVLEGAHVGRGKKWQEDMQGFIKEQEILTLGVKVWHVQEFEHYLVPETSFGQFHRGDTYIVRWQYMISNAGLRKQKGQSASPAATGRERYAYFFWHGQGSTINEQGASALATVKLDEERGPQVRVTQGQEPACFLNLFDGAMVVYNGKREDTNTNADIRWRMFCLRGDIAGESSLLEIPVSITNLRSRSSIVLLNTRTGVCYIWHGVKSPQHHRELVVSAVQLLKDRHPVELNLHRNAHLTITQAEEGKENTEIWSALNSKDITLYHSLLKDPEVFDYTPRLFYMTSVNLVFEVKELLNPARVPTVTTPFPFFQSDLYKASQPALFLIDVGHCVYLWQGWWPVGDEDVENVHTGSAAVRFNIDRRCAMETTLNYCKEKANDGKMPEAYIVCAGLEPKVFRNLFPYWEPDSTVQSLAQQEGKPDGYCEQVKDVYKKLTQTCYSLEELSERPLPEGVDPLRLESYLSDQDFEKLLEMNKETFYALPTWKQTQLKQTHSLF